MPRILILSAAVCAAALILACPGPAPEEECNATKFCAAGFTCEASKCVAQSGGGGGRVCPEPTSTIPTNLVDNPGFECGDPPSAWSQGFFGTISKTAARTGQAAGRWTATATASSTQTHYWLTSDVEAPVTEKQFVCVSAYVKGTGTNAVIRLQLVQTNGTGLSRQSFAQPLTADWKRIENSTEVLQGEKGASFGVGLRQATAGQYIDVDDAAMWISGQPDGGCSQR